MATRIELTRSDETASICMLPPEGKPPTLDHTVLEQLAAAVEALEQDPPRSLVIRSAAAKYFCVGANINCLKEMNEQTIRPWVEHGHDVLNRLEDLPCPVIARVAGFALGGGLELAMCCDLIFTEASARFGLPEASLGFIPGWGGCRRLGERVGISAAKHLYFASRVVDAQEALRLGLVDFVGSSGVELDAEIEAYTKQVLANSAYALSTFKELLNGEQRAARERNREAEATHSVGCLRDPQTQQRLGDFLIRKKK